MAASAGAVHFYHVFWRGFLDSTLESGGDPRTFHGENESYLIDDIMLTRGMAKRQKFDRPSAKIATSLIDHYMFQVFLSGHTRSRLIIRRKLGKAFAFYTKPYSPDGSFAAFAGSAPTKRRAVE